MTGQLLAALVTVGVGLILLAALVWVLLRHVRRFTRASAVMRAGLAERIAPLRVPLGKRANPSLPRAE